MNARTNVGLTIAVLLALAAIGCSKDAPKEKGGPPPEKGALSKEKATEILLKTTYAAPDECGVSTSNIQKVNETTYKYSLGDKNDQECAEALVAAQLATIGECADSGCTGGCCAKKITPVSPARIKKDRFSFPCGKYEGVEATSITTDGKKAKVKVKRSLVLDEALLTKVATCKIDKPTLAKEEPNRDFVRDDDGNWTLAD